MSVNGAKSTEQGSISLNSIVLSSPISGEHQIEQLEGKRDSKTEQERLDNQVFKHAGRLRHFYTRWRELTTYLSYVKGFRLPLRLMPKQKFIPKERKWSESEYEAIFSSINKLLALRAVEKVYIRLLQDL